MTCLLHRDPVIVASSTDQRPCDALGAADRQNAYQQMRLGQESSKKHRQTSGNAKFPYWETWGSDVQHGCKGHIAVAC